MTKIVINKQIGGFNLTPQAIYFYANLKKLNIQMYRFEDIDKIYKKSSLYMESGFPVWFCILENGLEFPEEVNEEFIFNNVFSSFNYFIQIATNTVLFIRFLRGAINRNY